MFNRIIVAACMAAVVNSQTNYQSNYDCLECKGKCTRIQTDLEKPCVDDCRAKLNKDYPTNNGYSLPQCPVYTYPCTDWATRDEWQAASDKFDARLPLCYHIGVGRECDKSADPAVRTCEASAVALCAIPCGLATVGGGGGGDDSGGTGGGGGGSDGGGGNGGGGGGSDGGGGTGGGGGGNNDGGGNEDGGANYDGYDYARTPPPYRPPSPSPYRSPPPPAPVDGEETCYSYGGGRYWAWQEYRQGTAKCLAPVLNAEFAGKLNDDCTYVGMSTDSYADCQTTVANINKDDKYKGPPMICNTYFVRYPTGDPNNYYVPAWTSQADCIKGSKALMDVIDRGPSPPYQGDTYQDEDEYDGDYSSYSYTRAPSPYRSPPPPSPYRGPSPGTCRTRKRREGHSLGFSGYSGLWGSLGYSEYYNGVSTPTPPPPTPPSPTCSSDKSKCCNDKCVDSFYIHDGDNDCGDGSDESSPPFQCAVTPPTPPPPTPPPPTCSSDKSKCCNGKCVDSDYIHDGDNDCGDGSDESSPPFQCAVSPPTPPPPTPPPPTPPPPTCSSDKSKCCNGKCVDSDYIHDGDNDCGDGSDESSPPFQCSAARDTENNAMLTVTEPADDIAVSGACFLALNGAYFKQGTTKGGKPYYKGGAGGAYYIYHDRDCDDAGGPFDNSYWFIDNEKPSTIADEALFCGDGTCIISAYSAASTSNTPPGGGSTWTMYCNGEWQDARVTIEDASDEMTSYGEQGIYGATAFNDDGVADASYLSAGAIAGITVGGVLFTILVGICCCYTCGYCCFAKNATASLDTAVNALNAGKNTINDYAEPTTNSTETTKDAVLSPTSSDTPQVASSGQPEYYRASATLDSGRTASTIQETSMIIAGPQRSSSEAEILDQPHPANARNRALPAYPSVPGYSPMARRKSLVLSNASAMTGTSLTDGEILNSTAPSPAESRDGNAFDNVAVATYQFATASKNVQTAKPRHLPKLDLNQMSSIIMNPTLSAKTPSSAFGIEGNALETPKQIAGKQTANYFFASASGPPRQESGPLRQTSEV